MKGLYTYYSFSNNSPFTGTTVYVALDIPYTVAMTEAHTASLIGHPFVMPTASSDANFIFNTTLGETIFTACIYLRRNSTAIR